MAFKRIELPKEEVIADFDPLNAPANPVVEPVVQPVALVKKPKKTELTKPELAEKGLQDYLNTSAENFNKYESVSISEESNVLIDAVKAVSKNGAFSKKAYELQKYLHVGLQLKLMAEAQAETNPELLKLFAGLYNDSRRSRDRGI